MKINELIGDQLYQINLILWMLQPSPTSGIEPLFYKNEFNLQFIEPDLPLPLELKDKLNSDGIQASDPVTPDIVLFHKTDGYMLIECKKSMFGYSREDDHVASQVKQAFSLLLQTPKIFASATPELKSKSISNVSLAYLSAHDAGVDQSEGLNEIKKDLEQKGYKTIGCGLLALSAKDKTIYLNNADFRKSPKSLKRFTGKEQVIVQKLEDEHQDPRPLYFIPWMPGASDDIDQYGHAAFGNRMLSEVAAIIGPETPPCDVNLVVDDILGRATQGYFLYWNRSKKTLKDMRSNTKRLIKNQLRRSSSSLRIEPLGNPSVGWKVHIPDNKTRSDILRELRKWQAEKWNKELQPDLFDELEDED